MLKLLNIYKTYGDRDNRVRALNNVSLTFRDNEFVSILGPSGCGKTTLLNIIGGLDRYSRGDLIINGRSTRRYRDRDWDTYRNHTIGFVFQTYNLIPHLTVLENVEMALTLSGVSKRVRRHKAKVALKQVGLLSQLNKKPNQMSGGQMQRVAIARALVNNPDIILADEPTGALDTQTSVQVMDILKEVAKDRLVIMVTHNPELAEKYSTRIIKLLDGELVSDTNPIGEGERFERKIVGKRNQSKMNFITAVKSSLKNLWSKKGRTFITGFAGSIGIIGIALVLSLSTGLNSYIATLQAETMLEYPIQVMRVGYKEEDLLKIAEEFDSSELEEFPSDEYILPYKPLSTSDLMHYNTLTEDYVKYIENIDSSLLTSVKYQRALQMNILTKGVEKGETKYKKLNTSNISWQELVNNDEYLRDKYDILDGDLPSDYDEAVLVVDRYNRIPQVILDELRISYEEGKSLSFSKIIGTEFKVILNDAWYEENDVGVFKAREEDDYKEMYDSNDSIKVKIVGIIRINQETNFDMMQTGVCYTQALTDYVLEDCKVSKVGKAQLKDEDTNVLTGMAFNALTTRDTVLQTIGASSVPTSIEIYPADFDAKDEILSYLDDYNVDKEEKDKVFYIDISSIALAMVGTLIDVISYVLVAFSSVSLVVSSIMIGIITYVSVIERTKEIGVLRAMGARKKDISRIFNAETLIIGFLAGTFGVLISAGCCLIINQIISNLVGVTIRAYLPISKAIMLVTISMGLTFIAGLVPSRIAAKKDPVVALRSE